ncbi:ABC transporter permease [Candidatus Atelocyanobacterium thalassae]|uniref:Glutathione transport system permease protein GsiC n=1 Tax=cyanobacterium endosymbiont of Braarudosphaera bigelowii TaxID=1285375 RepID=A0ABM7U5A9_9CHRO|nr:ABC transporter permease subunit [Candidatus Atelocyanobacterium thalassa]BDA39901.1 glutathione transport system permease protein GsiC [cyanobacterium endosymbiont of Braarudosphaera bigelowii]
MFYISKRLFQGLLTILLTSILSFIIIQIAPGDYLDTLRQNPKISREIIQELNIRFGLDQPFYIQYWKWLAQVITHLNFGESFVYNRSVSSLLAERIPATLLLSIFSIVLTWIIAIPLGILSAVKQNTWIDKSLRIISYLGQGLPRFIAALIILIIAQHISPILPVGNMTSLEHDELSLVGKILDIGWHMILPTITLSIIGFAGLMRLMRGQMLDVMQRNYIVTARAKGLSEEKVIYNHALRNAINPLVTLLGLEFANLLGGAFIAEFFFNWPGLGRLILQAVTAQDLYLVMGSLTMSAVMLVIGNILADLLLVLVDPRIQLEKT